MSEDKIIKKAKLVVVIYTVVYAILTILATISAVGDMENMSTTEIGIGNIFSLVWFQLLVVVFMIVTYFMYAKKGRTGIITEFVLGIALFINVIVNTMIVSSFSPLALLSFIIPIAILVHAFLVLLRIYNLKREVKIKELFNIK